MWGDAFIYFKILMKSMLSSTETNSISYESPNTQLFGDRRMRVWHYRGDPTATSPEKTYKHAGDKSITPCAKPGPLTQRTIET